VSVLSFFLWEIEKRGGFWIYADSVSVRELNLSFMALIWFVCWVIFGLSALAMSSKYER